MYWIINFTITVIAQALVLRVQRARRPVRVARVRITVRCAVTHVS